MKKENGYWTLEICEEEALKYNQRREFSVKSKSAYNRARINKWLDEICSHMHSDKNPSGFWSLEKCKEEALKYTNKRDYMKKGKGSYASAYQNKWLDLICGHMDELRKHPDYWCLENCKIEALKYTNKKDFINSSNVAYRSALKNKWIKLICSHMITPSTKMDRLIYCATFPDNSIYIGLTHDYERRIRNHMNPKSKSSIRDYYNMTGELPSFSKLSEYIHEDECSQLEINYIEHYTLLGYNVLNRMNGGGLGGQITIWTFEKCKKEALKFTRRVDFYKFSKSAYGSALKNKWLDLICGHMPEVVKPVGYWNFDNCNTEALRYETRNKFRKGSSGAYHSAMNNKWLDLICSHMVERMKPKNYWNLERCKEEALKYTSRYKFAKQSSGARYSAWKNGWLDEICAHMTKKVA